MDEEEFVVKTSPIKFTVEKDGIEYEFEPTEDVTDLDKLKNDIASIVRRFNIKVRSKNTIIVKSTTDIKQSFEEYYLRAKDVIREWYKEDPDREWSSNELMDAAKFDRSKRGSIMSKLTRENFIRCANPEGSRVERRYVKAEAMISPEAVEKQDMKKLEDERRLVREVLG